MASAALPPLERALADLAGARHYNVWLFSRAAPHLGRRVLDAGAGIGTFTKLAVGAGAEVVALEPNPAFVAHLREQFGNRPEVEVVEGSVEALADTLPRDFDSILCLNVLEHLPEDAAALAQLRGRLRPGGRLLLLVPAHPALYGSYDRGAGHVRRYSRAPLANLLESVGFDVEMLRHVNPIGAVGWLVRVRLRRSGEWPSGSFSTFDRLVPVLRPLDLLRLPFGLSLWAIGRSRG